MCEDKTPQNTTAHRHLHTAHKTHNIDTYSVSALCTLHHHHEDLINFLPPDSPCLYIAADMDMHCTRLYRQ